MQKLLAFEEPASKRSQLRKALKKQSKPSRASLSVPHVSEETSWSLDTQAVFFLQTFGGTAADAGSIEGNRIINELLFFEDLKRFNQIAFDTWWKTEKTLQRDVEQDSQPLQSRLDLAESEKQWLHYARLSAPDWHLADRPGAWQDDERMRLIGSFLSRLPANLHLTAGAKNIAARGEENFDLVRSIWDECVAASRSNLPGDFLPEIILLVEGQTETILLPAFARILGTSLNALAVNVEACGGAQQVVRHYLTLRELTVLPIVCVLDSDVTESAEIIEDSLRSGDRLLMIGSGEIEDTFSDASFLRLIDLYLRRHGYLEPFTLEDLNSRGASRTEVLDKKFKSRGWGAFDKVGFAKLVAENLRESDIPSDGIKIINTLTGIHNAGIKLRFQP